MRLKLICENYYKSRIIEYPEMIRYLYPMESEFLFACTCIFVASLVEINILKHMFG